MREGGNSNVSLRGGGIIHDFLAWGDFFVCRLIGKGKAFKSIASLSISLICFLIPVKGLKMKEVGKSYRSIITGAMLRNINTFIYLHNYNKK